ncbi:uracil-DNA glycosylase family protein [Halorientalis regularis]|uniref:Uracil-DNA glycosylase n=1 Tax=Halorientalis regularis TaxID=660518 RepID=A0A1G7NXJ7_9EURY|nr:uracil-DNA glycosylase family protein [Halorientalis regularis]SDF78766.1 Uracil-DNA glycosylase [Halorientalis regularis]
MENVTDRLSNPFGMTYPCERPVPGYGDANAHFHVVGDHPGLHGGADAGVPFTDCPAADRLQRALAAADLLAATGTPPEVADTYLSYLYPCADGDPADGDYASAEPQFDAELRAITAHVLLPVGERAIAHVLETYTARPAPDDLDGLHATELRGGGFLVVPVAEPATWSGDDAERLVARLREVRGSDYRREADLGRFLPGGDSYFVR